ncbi:docking protein 3 [Chanos chanos]|uniref:Docking protein 3 n=1 Tax=Chanos chanos TaxID=29144 RepID=A0A6J2WIZ7_CHACN|nr:docking protein 3-like [Chanos chanos]
MDAHVKQGEVHLQHHKYVEKWKRYWMILYPSSRRGVARLEMTETGSDKPTVVRRQPDRRVIRLADCVSVVRLPPHAEACPRDNMTAFCVETETKRMVLAAERESCEDWVEKICEIAFQVGGGGAQSQGPPMEENQIYVSREDVREFKVTVQQSEAADHCKLQGTYWLEAGTESLVLKELETRKTLMEWPYRLLRRYGRDKLMFSIEAGRRCESGPGTFNFETRQGDEILNLIESAIREQKSLSVPKGHREPNSPLPRRPDSAISLDTFSSVSSDSGESSECVHCESASGTDSTECLSSDAVSPAEPIYSTPIDAVGFSKSVYSERSKATGSAQTVNIKLTNEVGLDEPIYSQPADAVNSQVILRRDQNSTPVKHQQCNPTEPIYSNPVDLVHSASNANQHIYANPADALNQPASSATSHHGNQSEPVYSKVNRLVSPHVGQKSPRPNHITEEPIYSEPEVVTNSRPDEVQQQDQKRDELFPIYSKVNKRPKSPQPQPKSPRCGRQSPEVIYETLGEI